MKSYKIFHFFLFFFSFSLFIGISNLSAKGKCKEDIKKFCPDVKKGEGRIFECLNQNYDQLSDTCKQKISKTREKWQMFKENCGKDLDQFCPNTIPGKGRIRACLAKNKDQITEQCKQFLKNKQPKQKDELESISRIEKEIEKVE